MATSQVWLVRWRNQCRRSAIPRFYDYVEIAEKAALAAVKSTKRAGLSILAAMQTLAQTDPDIARLIAQEERRQRDSMRLIPSENYTSLAVMQATGSVLTNKYSEGYPHKRYYEGQVNIDEVESLAIARAKSLFGADHANVQPYSGSPANLAVYFAFLKPGDTVMGLELPSGGHLTHGWSVSITGSYFRSVPYQVRRDTARLDYDAIRDLAKKEKPKLLIAGGTALSRIIDFSIFGSIAQEIGAIFLADIAHISGLVATGAHPSPLPYADVVSTTTHKTLRGPRGGMLMCKSQHQKAIDKSVFPGLQGGPHNHTTAGIAVALKEAAHPDFKSYGHAIVKNAKALAEALLGHGFSLVSGGTDNHLILIDLTNKNVSGKIAAQALDKAGIECNYNTVPFDPRKPFDPSGLRIGTPAITSRGMGPSEMIQLASWMADVVARPDDQTSIERVRGQVKELCQKFPAPGILVKDG